jgi:hypothetical protein
MAALTGTKTPRQGNDHDGFCPTISAFHNISGLWPDVMVEIEKLR